MANTLFWLAMAVVVVLVFMGINRLAMLNVFGYKKIEGEWKQVGWQEHYMTFEILGAYGAFAVVFSCLIYLLAAVVLNYTGLDKTYGIETGLQAVRTYFRL